MHEQLHLPLNAPTEPAALRVMYLASGSKGNAVVVEAAGERLLLDCGLGRRDLLSRLAEAELELESFCGCMLTHTHRDHWKPPALRLLANHGIPLHIHAGHVQAMAKTPGYRKLNRDGRLHAHGFAGKPWPAFDAGPFSVQPLRISHDAPASHGFAIRCGGVLFVHLADVGALTDAHIECAAHADVLSLEFNHDVHALRTSGRPYHLIRRIESVYGHLSNAQAAAGLTAVLAQGNGRLQQLIAVHVSEECNDPGLVRDTALAALGEAGSSAGFTAAVQRCCTGWIGTAAGSGERGAAS